MNELYIVIKYSNSLNLIISKISLNIIRERDL